MNIFDEVLFPKTTKKGPKQGISGLNKPMSNREIDETNESLISFRNRFNLSKESSPD